MFRISQAIVAAALAVALPAQAESTSRTLMAEAKPMTSDGKLIGCSIEFMGTTEDHAYKDGGTVAYGGSVSMMITGQKDIRLGFKLSPGDLVTDVGGKMKVVPFLPASVFLASRDGRSNSEDMVDTKESDTGGRLAVFEFGGNTANVYENISYGDRFDFVFNRLSGGLDIRSWVDIAKEGDTSINETWRDCTIKVLEESVKAHE